MQLKPLFQIILPAWRSMALYLELYLVFIYKNYQYNYHVFQYFLPKILYFSYFEDRNSSNRRYLYRLLCGINFQNADTCVFYILLCFQNVLCFPVIVKKFNFVVCVPPTFDISYSVINSKWISCNMAFMVFKSKNLSSQKKNFTAGPEFATAPI